MKTQALIKIIFIFVILCLAINSPTLAQIYEDPITGNVGIGTTSPSTRLNIIGGGVLIGPLSGGENEGSFLSITGYNDDSPTVFLSAIDESGDLDFQLKSSAGSHGTPIGYFRGNVGIGTTSPSNKLDVNGEIQCSGLFKVSDERVKKNITPITNPLDKVLALEGVEFEWRKEEFPERDFKEGRKIGFIAQKVEEVLPEVVSTDDEGYKSVEYGNIVGVLVEAIKVQQAQIDWLKEQIYQLKAQNGRQ